jgi:hypothetical protein
MATLFFAKMWFKNTNGHALVTAQIVADLQTDSRDKDGM